MSCHSRLRTRDHFPSGPHRNIVIPAAAAALCIVSLGSMLHGAWSGLPGTALLLSAGFAILACAALLVTRWSALGSFVLTLGFCVAAVDSSHINGPIFLVPLAALIAVVSDRGAVLGSVLGVLGGILLVLAATVTPTNITYGVIWLLVGLLAGTMIRGRRRFFAQMEEQHRWQVTSEEEEMRRVIAEERLRIARELHDIIGHTLSVIALQAGVAEHVLDSNPHAAQQAMHAVRDVSRHALGELRHELALLRGDVADPEEGSEPVAIAGIPSLIANVSSTGISVTYDCQGDAEELPSVLSAACYRIVQESLTNAVRHGGQGVRITVSIAILPHSVEIHVHNDGTGVSSLIPGAGIAGMQARAQSLGGSCTALPDSTGGVTVTASLPREKWS